MRRLFTLILLLSLTALLLPRTGRAQNEVQLDSLEINLWPEYDRAEMLVMYICGLPSKSWPVTLTFRIPKTAIRPSEVAVRTEDGGLYETPFTYKVEGEYIVVSFEATTQNFQLEYYDPLTIDGSKRSYGFIWPGDYAARNVAIMVQQPVDATYMQLTPSTSVSSHTNPEGLVYYRQELDAMQKGATYSFSLSYQKNTNTLTYEKQKIEPAGALPQSMWIRGLPWAIGFVALLVIAGGVLFYWRSGLPQAGEKKRRRRKAAAGGIVEAAAPDDSGVYCHRCGRRAALSDVFCRSCGTKLRI